MARKASMPKSRSPFIPRRPEASCEATPCLCLSAFLSVATTYTPHLCPLHTCVIIQLVRVAAVADTLRRRRSSAVTAVATLLHRRRQALLRQGLEELVALGRREAEREGRELRARVLAVRKQRAARVLVLTRSWACWKAFAAASRSARRCERERGLSIIKSAFVTLVFACRINEKSVPSQ